MKEVNKAAQAAQAAQRHTIQMSAQGLIQRRTKGHEPPKGHHHLARQRVFDSPTLGSLASARRLLASDQPGNHINN